MSEEGSSDLGAWTGAVIDAQQCFFLGMGGMGDGGCGTDEYGDGGRIYCVSFFVCNLLYLTCDIKVRDLW